MTSKTPVLGFALLVLGAAAGRLGATEQKNSPVTKVVTLLKDMMAQLEKEAKEDQDVMDAMLCWCETNDKEKTKAIADAKVKIQQCASTAESNTALNTQLKNEIEEANKELTEDGEALEAATALRNKQLAEFTEEEKDMISSIESMGKAINALSKHHTSFLQISSASEAMDTLSNLGTSGLAKVKMTLRKHIDMIKESITPHQRRAVMAFIQEGHRYNPEYKPQSGAIFGVIEAMKEEFEKNLANSQKEESTNQQAYVDMKAAKEAEIKAGNEAVEMKTNQMAEAGEKAAQAAQDKEQTEEALAADIKFLAALKEQCKNVDAEFEARVKDRQLEMGAVSKALEILTSEDAQDLVSRTLGLAQQPALLQKSMQTVRNAAANRLLETARSVHSPMLSAMAVRMRLDAFGKVKEALQDMIDKLLKEKEDEIKQKDFCVDELNNNLRDTETEDRKKADAIAKAEDHAQNIARLAKEIAELKDQIKAMQVEIKKAGEEREKANTEYQETVADQRATQKLLASALNVLKSFYEKGALMQMRSSSGAPAGPPPPPGFKKREGAASGGVMGMIQGIIDDAKAMEAEAIKAEEDSMTGFEGFIKESNASIEEKQKQIITKTDEKAREEQDKVMEEGNRDAAQTAWDQLRSENLDLHSSCDYLIKNFEVRLERRDEEVEALKQGLATFSGATFSSFIQYNW